MSFNIIAIDDEPIALQALAKCIKEARPDCDLRQFTDPVDVITEIKINGFEPDVAFMDIEMYGIGGIELAKAVKDLSPSTKIVFVTGFSDYTIDAFKLHAHGYIMKPVATEDIEREFAAMDDLVSSMPETQKSRISVSTFGQFEIYVDETPVKFSRSKSKELLAFLIYRRGAGCNAREIASILFGDKEYTSSLKNQIQNIKLDMIKSLNENGIGDIIINQRNNLAVDISKISCDYYDFLDYNVDAINTYSGEFMVGYSWAEFATEWLDSKSDDTVIK